MAIGRKQVELGYPIHLVAVHQVLPAGVINIHQNNVKTVLGGSLKLERSTQNRLDVVLVNVDNPRWQDLVNRYEVNGIPQLNLFSANGQPRGKSIGLRKPDELIALSAALINDQPLPQFRGVGSVSSLEGENTFQAAVTQTGPRSHS